MPTPPGGGSWMAGATGIDAVECASQSDVGRARSENQDACAELSNHAGERLFVTADGMGGHRGGATASALCLEVVAREFEVEDRAPALRVALGLEQASAAIHKRSREEPELEGMGAAAVSLLLSPDGTAFVAWVGDSRAYRLRDGALESLTRDHSLVAEWARSGVLSADEAGSHPKRHELTRAIGVRSEVSVDVEPVDVRAGDRFLLCSDGLCAVVPESDIAALLGDGAPAAAARALIDAANELGGPDNVTVQVAQIPRAESAEEIDEDAFEWGDASPLAEAALDSTADAPSTSADDDDSADDDTAITDSAAAAPDAPGEDDAEAFFCAAPAAAPPAASPPVKPLVIPPDAFTSPPPARKRMRLHVWSVMLGAVSAAAIFSLGVISYRLTADRGSGDTTGVQASEPDGAPRRPRTPRRAPAIHPQVELLPTREASAEPSLEPAAAAATAAVANAAVANAAAPSQPVDPSVAYYTPVPPVPDTSAHDLPTEVRAFLDAWLRAVAEGDYRRHFELGFRVPQPEFERTWGARESFRLVDEIVLDAERGEPGVYYVELTLSYAFRDATGRYRTQDVHRMLLRPSEQGLRFGGHWQ